MPKTSRENDEQIQRLVIRKRVYPNVVDEDEVRRNESGSSIEIVLQFDGKKETFIEQGKIYPSQLLSNDFVR